MEACYSSSLLVGLTYIYISTACPFNISTMLMCWPAFSYPTCPYRVVIIAVYV